MPQNKWLNLGCGREILPRERRPEYALVPESVFTWPLWENIDRNAAPGVDCVMDLFSYPWNLPSDSYDGALLCHLAEHIPHDIRIDRHSAGHSTNFPFHDRATELAQMQDSWFCFFSELYRVLTPGAQVYVLSPYATSSGYLSDPTHTRPITELVLQHSMQPNPDAPFEYANGGINFKMIETRFAIMDHYKHLLPTQDDPPHIASAKSEQLQHLMHSQWNVVSDIFARLEVIK